MKHKSLFKRAMAWALTGLLAVGTMGGAALAANVADATIDMSRTGSLTLYKYIQGETMDDLSGMTSEEVAAYVYEHPDGLEAEAGVIYRYLKVADIAQYADGDTVAVGYAIDEDTVEFLGVTEEDIAATVDGVEYYSSDTLDAALKTKSATQTEVFMREQEAEATPETDENGKTTVTDLELGLYLVCEYSYPAETEADADHCAPFLISVPSTNAEGDTWVYDVEAIPKNLVSEVTNDKVIVNNDGSETKELDAEIGESVAFLIRSDVPSAVGKLETYLVRDTQSDGLTYDEDSYAVYGVAEDGTRTALADGKDFAFTSEDNVLTWDFETTALADDEGWAAYSSVEIYYTAHLNENAVIGGEGNPNELETVYSRYTNTDVDGRNGSDGGDDEDLVVKTVTPEENPVVYTYAIDVVKQDSSTGAALSGVTFALLDADKNELTVSQREDGTYYLDTTGTETLTTDASGEFKIIGVQADTYYLRELAAPDGYKNLDGDIEITISSNELTYVQDEDGQYAVADVSASYVTSTWPSQKSFALALTATNGSYTHFGTSDLTAEGELVAMYDTEDLTWTCNYAMGSKDAGSDSGVVKLTVLNAPKATMPKTGTDAGFWLMVAGCVVVAAGVVLCLASFKGRRRKDSKPADQG